MSVVATLAAADREADERGWVSSRRSFPSKAMTDAGLPRSPLFVIADDVVEPGQGFGRHGHRDMEILSYVVAGTLEHADSTQGASVLRHGEIQRMTAGAGIEHSEYNASASEPVRFLQIWIKPDATGLAPGYAHAAFDPTRSLTRSPALWKLQSRSTRQWCCGVPRPRRASGSTCRSRMARPLGCMGSEEPRRSRTAS